MLSGAELIPPARAMERPWAGAETGAGRVVCGLRRWSWRPRQRRWWCWGLALCCFHLWTGRGDIYSTLGKTGLFRIYTNSSLKSTEKLNKCIVHSRLTPCFIRDAPYGFFSAGSDKRISYWSAMKGRYYSIRNPLMSRRRGNLSQQQNITRTRAIAK